MITFGFLLVGTLTAAATVGSANSHAQAKAPAYQPAEWAKIVDAAKKEGKVTWYSGAPVDLANALQAAFRKAYPNIQVELERGPSGAMTAKIDRERETGVDGADAYVTSEIGWMVGLNKDGKLWPLAGPSTVGYPAKYIYGSVAGVGIEPVVIPYNTKMVANAPTGYTDLLRPEYKNRMASNELVGTFIIAWYDWVEKTQGADFLRKLRAQNPKLYNGGAPIGQAVASGEAAIGAFAIPSNVTALMAAGAPIKYVVPNPGLGVEFVVAAFGWAKRPNAARVLTDFVMSKEAQTIWHGPGNSASPLPGIPGSLNVANITSWDSTIWTDEKTTQYRLYWEKIFK